MSRRPFLAMTLWCVALGGVRLVWPRETSKIGMVVTASGCRVSECRTEYSLLTKSVGCSSGGLLGHGDWTTTRGGERVGCSLEPLGCQAVQSGLKRFVSCGTRMNLESGDRLSCHCAEGSNALAR